MNPLAKALWYIETNSGNAVSLDDVAACAGVSKFHLLRAFSAATGLSIMRYLRGRRLSAAAQRLAAGAPDILAVAIDAGYGSHEAFTRAFREQFGRTPEALRAQGNLDGVALLAPLRLDGDCIAIDPPRLADGPLLLVAGILERYGADHSSAGIPAQWQRFAGFIGQLRAQVGTTTYGVCHNTDDEGNMDYLCAVQVGDFSALPPELSRLRIAPRRYAVFFHRGHVSAIRPTWNAIWNDWLPQSNYVAADAPLIERYDDRFDSQSGNGGLEIWLPIAVNPDPKTVTG